MVFPEDRAPELSPGEQAEAPQQYTGERGERKSAWRAQLCECPDSEVLRENAGFRLWGQADVHNTHPSKSNPFQILYLQPQLGPGWLAAYKSFLVSQFPFPLFKLLLTCSNLSHHPLHTHPLSRWQSSSVPISLSALCNLTVAFLPSFCTEAVSLLLPHQMWVP